MNKDWKTTELGNICSIFDNLRKPISTMERSKIRGLYPYFGAANAIDSINKYQFDGHYVLIAEDASVIDKNGYPILQNVKGKFWVSNHAHVLQGNEKILTNYIYYYLKNTKIKPYLTGSVQLKLNQDNLKRILIRYPELNQQRKITDILSSLDDKIEHNNKINKNLEELAQTLYKRWFVDFEFPNEKGLPYQSSGGEMVESELGLIPKDWQISNIGKVCNTVLGGTPSRKIESYWNGNINWINSGKINEIRVINPSEKITQYGLENSSTKLLPRKTTVIAITGATLGAVSLLEIETCANQSVIGIYQSDLLPYSFIYSIIKNKINDIIGRQSGGAQQHINKNDLNSYRIVLPPSNIIKTFHNYVVDFHDEIANQLFQNDKLSKLRDELLPKLMSGEIEVHVGEENGA
jgi:type I restriction enzyme S subunit